MSTEQQVSRTLRRMVESGRYGGIFEFSSNYMCHVLQDACHTGVIDWDTFNEATEAVHAYLEYLQQDVDYDLRGDMLETALRNNGLPSSLKDRVALYLDWDNRPLPYGDY